MTQDASARPDPATDPAVRRRVQRALDDLLAAARDVAARYSDKEGFYAAPDPVSDVGDVTGLIAAGHNQVVSRLQDQLDETRRVMREVYAELDDYKRSIIGPGYKPTRPTL